MHDLSTTLLDVKVSSGNEDKINKIIKVTKKQILLTEVKKNSTK